MTPARCTRRTFLGIAATTAMAFRARGATMADSPQQSLRRAVEYLWRQQAEDGGWHSPQYGNLRSGQALTPFLLDALLAVPESLAPRPKGGVSRAMEFIRQRIDDHGALGHADPDIVEYPVYSTSYALQVAVTVEPQRPQEMQIVEMTRFLAGAQFQEKNGFEPSAAAYGGWGLDAPKSPGVAGHMDLAHTRRALDALAAFEKWSPFDIPIYDRAPLRARAEEFLALVQKRPQAAARQPLTSEAAALSCVRPPGPPFDGGFYFSPVVLAANKGRVEDEPAPHWRSYATATCDGILALLAAGVPLEDERVAAAVEWLKQHTDVDYAQGVPTEHPEPWGDAIRFYHYSVRGEAYRRLDFPKADRAMLAAAVAKQQRDDGSFVNVVSPLMKEDDPLLCTGLATVALASCL